MITKSFRASTIELPDFVQMCANHRFILISFPLEGATLFSIEESEALLEVLLDICPNARALAHNWLLDEQKREYREGGSP